jgi:hypothetical protein
MLTVTCQHGLLNGSANKRLESLIKPKIQVNVPIEAKSFSGCIPHKHWIKSIKSIKSIKKTNQQYVLA